MADIEALRRAAAAPDWLDRMRAARELAALPDLTPVREELVALLDDEEPAVAKATAETLLQRSDDDLAELAVGVLGDERPSPEGPNHQPLVSIAGRPRETAPYPRRAGAYLVDTVFAIALSVPAGALVAGEPLFPDEPDEATRYAVGTLVWFLYAVVSMALTNGRTPGKALLGLRVVRRSGERVGVAFATLRDVVVKAVLLPALAAFLPESLSVLYLLVFVELLWPLFDGENRAIHDRIVGSYVVVD